MTVDDAVLRDILERLRALEDRVVRQADTVNRTQHAPQPSAEAIGDVLLIGPWQPENTRTMLTSLGHLPPNRPKPRRRRRANRDRVKP